MIIEVELYLPDTIMTHRWIWPVQTIRVWMILEVQLNRTMGNTRYSSSLFTISDRAQKSKNQLGSAHRWIVF